MKNPSILYPRYLDPLTQRRCTPETAIDRLSRPYLWRSGTLVRLRRLQGFVVRTFRAGFGRAAALAGR